MRCLTLFVMVFALNSSPTVQGTLPNSGQASQVKPMPAHQLLPASEALPKTTAHQPTSPTVTNPPSTAPSEPIPAETFSQLTLFLCGSGLALFVALLGWSDQIRGINKDTKDFATRFVEKTQIKRDDFLSAIKPTSPDGQLEAFTALMASRKLKTVPDIQLLSLFKLWNERWGALERLSSLKYNLTIALTISMFLGGVISLFTTSTSRLSVGTLRIRTEILLLLTPMLIIGAVIYIIMLSGKRERLFRTLLSEIEEKV